METDGEGPQETTFEEDPEMIASLQGLEDYEDLLRDI